MAKVTGTVISSYPLKGTTVIRTPHGTVLEGREISSNPLNGTSTIEF